MNPIMDDLEVPDGWGFATTLDRRDFLKLTTTGLLVTFVVSPALGRSAAVPFQGGRSGSPPDSGWR